MTDNNCDDKCELINTKESDNVDSDKSFESCVNSVADGINNVLIKDDDSERSFQSCSNNNQEKSNVEPLNSNHEDDDEDDDIRPGSCRENPSSDEETSSWDENKDNWIYDVEYLKESENKTQLPEAETTIGNDLKLFKEDLDYIIENHVTKDNEFNEINNPTFIPTNGKFYMHDLRFDDYSNNEMKKTNKNEKTFPNKSNDENWKHDLYVESKQKPISKLELIDKYGADIRHKNDFQEIKGNKFKRNNQYRTNTKRYNYRNNRNYYEYEYDYNDYYDYYDSYYGYYYSGDGFYDYNHYGSQYNSRNRPYKDFNRNQSRSDYKNYKSNSPETKPKKSSKPPSKYSQISEYTDIKITVNLDNFGSRQIENINNKNQNSNFRRLDGFSTDENLDSVEPCNHSTPKNDHKENDSTNKKSLSDLPKRKGTNNSLFRNQGETRKPGNIAPKRSNYHPFPRNFSESQRGENNSPHQRIYGKPQQKFSESNYNNEYERTQGKSQLLSNRYKQTVPDWVNTKYEWDANCDFQDVIEEMPPLTEKEINQLQKRPMNSHNPPPPPPRFSREKSAPQFVDNKTNQNARNQTTFVPKRYSELRNQSEPPPQSSPHAEPPPPAPPHPPQIINYQQMLPSLEYYNNLQPLLLNMNHHHSASANSPQQSSSNTFSSLHHPAAPPPPHMVSLSSLIQPGTTAGTAFDNNNQQQFYIHPLYLPAAAATVGRLNQFSQPFQPSYASQTNSAYPTHSSAPATTSTTCNTPNNVSQNSRPVLGRS